MPVNNLKIKIAPFIYSSCLSQSSNYYRRIEVSRSGALSSICPCQFSMSPVVLNSPILLQSLRLIIVIINMSLRTNWALLRLTWMTWQKDTIVTRAFTVLTSQTLYSRVLIKATDVRIRYRNQTTHVCRTKWTWHMFVERSLQLGHGPIQPQNIITANK